MTSFSHRALTTAILTAALFVTASAQAQQKRQGKTTPPTAATPAPARPHESDKEIEAQRSGNLTWDAFIDAEARVFTKDNTALFPDKGFSLNDAALYVSKDFSRAKAFIDLPFSSAAGTGEFEFANKKAQAFLRVDYTPNFSVRMGQYDSFFGVEPEDSRDRFFANGGFINELITPQTHTGIQVDYKVEALTLSGQIANPNSASLMGDNNPEFDVQGRFNFASGYAGIGLGINEGKNIPTGNKTNMLVDVIGGWAQDKLRLDGEFAIKKQAGSDATTNAFGVYGTYRQDQGLAYGGRFEYVKDAPLGTDLAKSVITLSAGPSFQVVPDLILRGDLSLATVDFDVTEDITSLGLTFSAVADF